MKRRGIRRCRKCGNRYPFPAGFGTTRTGKVSCYCASCAPVFRACQTCGRLCKAPEKIRPLGRRCFECQHDTTMAYQRRYYDANRKRIAARVKAWRKANPDRAAEHRRTAWRNLRADPERYGERLVRERIGRRLRGTAKGVFAFPAYDGWKPPPPAHGQSNHQAPILDATALADWLRFEFGAWPLEETARRLGVNEATVRRLMSGEQRHVSLHIADRMLVGADCVHLLALLYPDEEAVAV
jgi:hypothetical protein